MHISQLDTPVAIVDLDRLEANIARVQAYLDKHGILSECGFREDAAFARECQADGILSGLQLC